MNSTIIDITSFIINIAQKEPYQSLVFVSSTNPARAFEDGKRGLIEDVAKAAAVPIISLTYVSSINITKNFNIELLTIADLQTKMYDKILAKIRHLFHLTGQARIVLVMDEDASNSNSLQAIFEDCWRKKLLNVLAIFRDFPMTLEFYSYSPYPVLHMEQMSAATGVVFPDRLKDLRGTPLNTFADQLTPTNMMTLKPDGSIELTGYAGHIANALRRKHNAKLDFSIPFKIGEKVFPPGLQSIIYNETVDLLVGMKLMNVSAAFYSYPVEQTSYCLMVPVEENLPTADFYKFISHLSVFVVVNVTSFILGVLLVIATYHKDKRKKFHVCDIFFEKTAVRGLYAQTFKFPSSSSTNLMLICILMSTLGMYFSTFYLGYLQSYFLHPPTQKKIENFADLQRARYKVLVLHMEGSGLLDAIRKSLDESVLQVIKNYTEFTTAIETLNTSYAYVVPTSHWNILKGKQQWFARPFFRLTDMCALVSVQKGFPVHPNSVLKNALERVIMQVSDSGLLQRWVDRTFLEMVEIGYMSFSDWSSPREKFKALQAKDLSFVGVLVSWYLGTAALVLIGELLVDKVTTRRRLHKSLQTEALK